MNFKCPHINKEIYTASEIKKVEKVIICEECDGTGPNLWICLQRNCLRIGCSEQLNDHSTEHFKRNNTHCIHMNLSSHRMWCYLCEKEVFLNIERNSIVNEAFILTDSDNCENSSHGSDTENDFRRNQGLVGLQNLANTCYMNSALQALSNIQPLKYYFLDCGDIVEHTIDTAPHRSKSGLTKSYLCLMNDLWCTNNRVKDYIAPRGILYGIRSVHPMFRGFQQHDTQEFLRCFMDQLHEELKEVSPNIPSEYCDSTTGHVVFYGRGNDHVVLKNEEELLLSSQNDSASQSEGEYETCDSGVSEQSSLFDETIQKRLYHDQMWITNGQSYSMKTINRDRPNSSRWQEQSETSGVQSATIQRSIISDVFDGKLLSSVQCLTCDRISNREETFQDLSLPIPNRDYLNVLHQTHSVSTQNINSSGYGLRTVAATSGTELVKSDGWLAWIWNMLRFWIWGPSITLHDCMASFFSADELKGDNMYSCEKCNKLRTGVKYSRILCLPEALCIHLKRFRHDLSYSSKISSHINFPMEGFDMCPYLHKDCTSNISTYNLVSVICHYGTVGSGHYTCFAKNEFTKKWYEFDDQNVTEVPIEMVQNCQAYVLFYRKRNPQMDLIRSEAAGISNMNPFQGSDIRFYVSREWITRLNTFAEPGPINNWAILCPHGGVPPNKVDIISRLAVPIPQQLWDYLYRTFGGGPVINMFYDCELCKRAAEILMRRQKYELAVFSKCNDMEDSNAIYAISMPWLRKWQMFARGLTNKEPGPIMNATIASNSDGCLTPPIRNVKLGSDYAQLNRPLWKFLYSIYGGGPEIKLRESLNGEIETATEDDDGGSNRVSKIPHNANDNNLDQRSMNIFQLNKTYQSDEDTTNRVKINATFDNTNDEMEQQPLQSNHHSMMTTKMKSTLLCDQTALKIRSKKRRNTMKNDGFFGPNGNYTSTKSAENLTECNINNDCQEDVKKDTSGAKKSKNSFRQDRNAQTENCAIKVMEKNKDSYYNNVGNTMHTKKKNHRGLKKKNNLKGRDECTASNQTSESSETEI